MFFKLGRFSPLLSVLGVSGFAALAGCDSGESSYGGLAGGASAGAPGGSGSTAGTSSTAGGSPVGGSSVGGSSAGSAGTSAGASAAGQGGGASGAGGAGAGAGGSATGGTAAGAGGTSAGAGGTSAGGAGGTAPLGGSSGSGGSAGGGSACAYKLCEDFESGTETTLPAGWTSFKGYGTASPQDQTITTAQFHGGAKSLQSNSAQQGISRIQRDLTPLGATASKHWGRIFYKVKSPAAKNPTNVLHVTFLSLMGTTENRVVDVVEQANSNVHQWLFNNPDDQGGKASSYSWTFDADWHCAEWFVDVGAKSYRFFSDAKEVTEIAFTGQDNQMSDYKAVIVGATHYQQDKLTEPFVVWFDDLAIHDTQIGCK